MTDEPADVPAQVRFAVSSFAPYMGFNWKWHEGPIDGNYDPDANLSVTLHTVEYATVSSPTQIALYQKGEYKGQGTPIAGAFISVAATSAPATLWRFASKFRASLPSTRSRFTT
jgi:hypothetical protein